MGLPIELPPLRERENDILILAKYFADEFAKENIAVRIEPSHPEKLWDEIMNLYNSPEKRNQIGTEARKFVADNFDIKQIAEIYKKIYEVL